MILKGSQRGGGGDLAAHLMKMEDNEHVRLHELRGFASDTLKGAFKEAEAVSLGTKCKQYLFSLSLSPPEDAKLAELDFERAIEAAEQRLNLQGQPRAVIFHEKEGRRHAHCVWSRIDAETMTARTHPFFKRKLTELSKSLYLDHGWNMPRGFIEAGMKDPTNFTLAEWQQAKRSGIDPRWSKVVLQDCWKASDGIGAFQGAIQAHGFFLARGDRRGFVVLYHDGEVHALPRMLDLKTKEVASRLGSPESLRSVEDTKRLIGQRMTPAIRRHIAESREAFRAKSTRLGDLKERMTREHRQARVEVETRQNFERESAARGQASRLPKGVAALWQRVTGQYRETRAAIEAETEMMVRRHIAERQAVIDQQAGQRAMLQAGFKTLRAAQARAFLDLRQDVGRYLALTRGDDAPARKVHQSREHGRGLKLER